MGVFFFIGIARKNLEQLFIYAPGEVYWKASGGARKSIEILCHFYSVIP